MYNITLDLSNTTQDLAARTRDLVATTNELRDHIADFDDFFRPIRNYFYWEPHCFDIPVCFSLKSLFDSLDGIDQTADKIQGLQADTDHLASLTP
jgi:RND superfamily putative drug exporter